MAHYKLILAYEGTQYSGFQRQLEKPSIQGIFEDALKKLGWQGRSIIAAGRTDTGVHASAQTISFELNWQHGDHKLLTALNFHLPNDIQVQRLVQTSAQFHPRYDALARSYCYRLYWQAARDPLRDRFAWRLDSAPDIALMNLAASEMLGEHDFIAFGHPFSETGTSIRRVEEAKWEQTGQNEMAFSITANAFLYHMIRRVVYVLVRIGMGEAPLSTVRLGLETGSTGIVALAPARGLTMTDVRYAEDIEI